MDQLQALNVPNLNPTAADFQYAPMQAFSNMGAARRIAEENTSALQQAFAASEAFKQQERPLTLEQMAAKTSLDRAAAKHSDVLSRYNTALADRYEQLTPSEVDTGKAVSLTKIGEAGLDLSAINASKMATMARTIRNQLQNSNSPLDNIRAAQVVAQLMGVEDDPEGKNIIRISTNLPAALDAIEAEAKHRALGTPKGIQAQLVQDTKVQVAEEATARAVTVAQETSRRQAQKTAEESQAKILQIQEKAINDYRDAGTALERKAQAETDPAKKAALIAQANEANKFASHMQQVANETTNQTKMLIRGLIDPEGKMPLAPPNPGVPQYPQTQQPPPPVINPPPVTAPSSQAPQAAALPPPGGVPANPKAPPWNSPEGQSWVERAKAANPGMNEIDIILEGRKRGKIS
jgi:uncharacterized protein (DUF924 family)